ncbi:MAG: RNA polymerase subunit sigma-70 [Planctomycetes bacterium]|nr:RNA polymerase subunit sigma-70 [Planctomycetota bacterium]MCB9870614.1 RNA polymerase subunit sigma-70 [Planctomycetota bacterium]MCB9889481.1 RNA polymerase subunit sigma-70 [Planctomycetota bacterium]
MQPLDTPIYRELHALAERRLAGSRPDHTLQPTALVHEAYLRMAQAGGGEERRAFFALAGRAMRSVLVDHARRRNADKRGGGHRAELPTTIVGPDQSPVDVLAVHDAVERLQQIDPQLAEIVDLILFAGLTAAEAGDVLGVSSRTVERGWRTARAFLRQALEDDSRGET